jgi:hypothetical protein
VTDRVLLNDKRESVLDGQYDGSDAALRNQKSRLRRSSQTALKELVGVAESNQIDNTEVFDPNEVFRLLRALLAPRQEDLEPDEFVTVVSPDKYGGEFVAYADALYVQMDKVMKPYRDSRFPDPEND